MVVFLIRAYYTLIVYLCQEHCGANCRRIFASLRKGGIRADAMASQRSFRVSHTTTKKQKKEAVKTSFFVFGADYETRSARFCARRHAPDRRTVPRTVLCFATVFSSLLYHNQRTKKEEVQDFFFLCLWSGLRDSNSLPSPWQGDALPDELNPQLQNQLYRYLSVLSRPKFIFDKLF